MIASGLSGAGSVKLIEFKKVQGPGETGVTPTPTPVEVGLPTESFTFQDPSPTSTSVVTAPSSDSTFGTLETLETPADVSPGTPTAPLVTPQGTTVETTSGGALMEFGPDLGMVSSYGANQLELPGPGSLLFGNHDVSYPTFQDTGLAAAQASGVAASLLSENPDMTPAQLREAIMGHFSADQEVPAPGTPLFADHEVNYPTFQDTGLAAAQASGVAASLLTENPDMTPAQLREAIMGRFGADQEVPAPGTPLFADHEVNYPTFQDTGLAAAQASGVAASLLTENPNMTPAQLREAIQGHFAR